MRRQAPLNFWIGLRLAAVALALWGVALLLLVDVDRLAAHW
jgi:hypothetical protein